MTMTCSEAWELQRFLEEKEAQLLHVLQRRGNIVIEKSREQSNEVHYSAERELAIGDSHRESCLLRAVRTALSRIDGGSFGTCSQCEAAISPGRLAAVPWALLCIACLERPPIGAIVD